jgi:hypothetical protein
VVKPSHNPIAAIGDQIVFDSDHGSQIGIVVNIVRDIGNAQQFAIVEVDDGVARIYQAIPTNTRT